MPQFNTIVPTTELEVVNQMLSAVGENPISDLDAAISNGETDIQMAVDIVRTIQREMLTHGWRFNTDLQRRIVNTTSDSEEGFTVPTDLLRFEVTIRTDQCGARPEKQDDGTYATYPTLLDLAIGSRTSGGTLRFIDRLTGSRVIAAADRPQIFLDVVFAVNFTDMPESARHFVTVRSAREFVQRLLGDKQVESYTDEDVVSAWRNLRKDQAHDKPLNMLTGSLDTWLKFGGRPRNVIGWR